VLSLGIHAVAISSLLKVIAFLLTPFDHWQVRVADGRPQSLRVFLGKYTSYSKNDHQLPTNCQPAELPVYLHRQ
jgi:hypothetical protein